jgi:hypothetical protein
MFGDNGPAVDLDAAREAVEEADVLVIGFDFTPDRLLIDLRPDTHGRTPPIVEIVEPLQSANDRAVWLSARRPRVAPPERFVFFVWPHSVGYLEASALLDHAARRLEREQHVDVREILRDAVLDLRSRERDEAFGAVRGVEGFETLWSRVRSRRPPCLATGSYWSDARCSSSRSSVSRKPSSTPIRTTWSRCSFDS